jgi:hypothetical protein
MAKTSQRKTVRAWVVPALATNALVIKGGMLKNPEVVHSVNVQGLELISIRKTTPWLNEMVCGMHWSRSPLKRTKIIEFLYDECLRLYAARSSGGVADSFEDDPMEQLNIPVVESFHLNEDGNPLPKKRKRTFNPKRNKTKNECNAEVEVEETYGRCTPKRLVAVYVCKTAEILIAQKDLTWILTYVRDEALAGGLRPLDKKQDDSSDVGDEDECHCSISWEARDGAWQARAKDSDGKLIRVTRVVPKRDSDTRQYYTVAEYAEQKAIMKNKVREYCDGFSSGSL